MQLPFLTIKDYAGRSLKPLAVRAARGGGHSLSWDENASEGRYGMVFTKVRNILAERGEQMTGLASLQYLDKKGFGNCVFRINSSKRQYFLKILGDSQGNRRELFVWKALGFENNGRRSGKPWIPGLPAEVFALDQLNSVLMPYYPGQLRELHGGAYELPMVLSLLLYLDETLSHLHREGLVFMDLCPENILYGEQSAESPITFFLADMGSVKRATGVQRNDPNWHRLCETITAPRVTRAETRPPDELFPDLESVEEQPGYDGYTLARTALILLGLNGDHHKEVQTPGCDAHDLENPLHPLKNELLQLLDILAAPLKGKPLDRDRLYQLFRAFFLDRARFAAENLDDPDFRDLWNQLLLGRLNRYRMMLTKEDKQQLPEELAAIFTRPASTGLRHALDGLTRLPNLILQKDWDQALATLQAIGDGPLPGMSRTARYSFQFHKKVLKTLARSHPGVVDYNPVEIQAPCLDQLPEKATLDALRRGHPVQLGLLHRQMIQTQGAP